MKTYSLTNSVGRLVFFSICDDDGVCISSCEAFFSHLKQRDCSAYTMRSYAIALAHFCTWLQQSGSRLDSVTRQTIGSYIAEFSQSNSQGAVKSKSKPKEPRTINHRLSVLASYFDFHIARDTEDGKGPWDKRINPASGKILDGELRHGMMGRDLAPRERCRDGFRRRLAHTIPEYLQPDQIQLLIDTASSYRDKAILTLLSRTGQRIGNWSALAGRHGVLGMELGDLDKRRNQIVVRLKGARDEHRVPIADEFWPLYERYIRDERRTSIDVSAAWIAARKGNGKPLSYASFESAIRYIGGKCGVRVTPHMFRHTLAQGVLEITGNMKVAQELLGHANISTTADLYTHADQSSLVRAIAAVKSAHSAAKCGPDPSQIRYAFAYDQETVDEFERVINGQPLLLQEPFEKSKL